MIGLVNLYKPKGMSSAQAVSRVRRILGEKAVGHMGTLDPMAEGVLVIGVGKATRLFDYLVQKRKAYIAKFKFGYETDTLDAFGEIVQTTNDIPSDTAVLSAVRGMIGKFEQLPPIYSAKHVDGRRAYKMARNGDRVALQPVPVEIYDAELICQPQPDELVFSIDCSAGTYIRSICRDAARACGSLATLTYLQRIVSGKFNVNDSVTFEQLEAGKEKVLIPVDKSLDISKIEIPDENYDDLNYGRKIKCSFDDDAFIYCRDQLFGIGNSNNGVLNLKTYLREDTQCLN